MLEAKNSLSELMRRAERGEPVVIRRGVKGKAFQLTPVREGVSRTLAPNPRWEGKIKFKDADIRASEWRDASG